MEPAGSGGARDYRKCPSNPLRVYLWYVRHIPNGPITGTEQTTEKTVENTMNNSEAPGIQPENPAQSFGEENNGLDETYNMCPASSPILELSQRVFNDIPVPTSGEDDRWRELVTQHSYIRYSLTVNCP